MNLRDAVKVLCAQREINQLFQADCTSSSSHAMEVFYQNKKSAFDMHQEKFNEVERECTLMRENHSKLIDEAKELKLKAKQVELNARSLFNQLEEKEAGELADARIKRDKFKGELEDVKQQRKLVQDLFDVGEPKILAQLSGKLAFSALQTTLKFFSREKCKVYALSLREEGVKASHIRAICQWIVMNGMEKSPAWKALCENPAEIGCDQNEWERRYPNGNITIPRTDDHLEAASYLGDLLGLDQSMSPSQFEKKRYKLSETDSIEHIAVHADSKHKPESPEGLGIFEANEDEADIRVQSNRKKAREMSDEEFAEISAIFKEEEKRRASAA